METVMPGHQLAAINKDGQLGICHNVMVIEKIV